MKDKKIMIIGGAGALGKSLIKRYYNNNEIIIFSRDEHKHYNLVKKYPKVKCIVGDIRDKDSVMNVLLRFNPQVVINTAALKHVPICEVNVYESVKTNIIGHQNVIECVNLNGRVETLIFISTDKACKPINVYGMCKAISEQLYVNFAEQQDDTKVVLVRYGNVLESTGSVIPYFKNLLEQGVSSLPITHSEMTRFLLTLEQASDLIDWACESPISHGKIAIPKIKSMKVTDIAKCLIKSYELDSSVRLEEIGMRDGEKLHEEMISSEEWMRTENHGDFFLIGQKNVKDESISYNSKDSLMDSEDTYNFLQDSGVI